ncbi:hypothetical protein Ssi03_19990 [Sphaerisporangium siamense]|nr:hypothetical protein Ssi03_19990 [Sphaerisporangium siamense]
MPPVVRRVSSVASPVSSARAARRASFLVYAAVLLAGLYDAALRHGDGGGGSPLPAGPWAPLGPGGPLSVVVFAAGIGALFALDLIESRRFRPGPPPARVAAALLGLRLALFVLVTAFDGSGLSHVLLVLVPFTARLSFGRTAGAVSAVACAAVVLAGYQWAAPGWPGDIEYVSDLLMLGVGLILSFAVAGVAAGAEEDRARLRESNARLAAYAGQAGELAAAAERVRVARDIHDGLGHHLTAVAVLLEKATAFGERDPALARQALADARESTRRALDDVRRSVRTLRAPAAPAPEFSLLAALTDLAAGAAGQAPAVELDLGGDETGYDPRVRTTLYRAAQEALTNARRHAGATRVSVGLALGDAEARLVVADDGRGFAAGAEGFGLTGMRERVRLAGGHLDLATGPGAGTRITITIPRAPAPPAHAGAVTPPFPAGMPPSPAGGTP